MIISLFKIIEMKVKKILESLFYFEFGFLFLSFVQSKKQKSLEQVYPILKINTKYCGLEKE